MEPDSLQDFQRNVGFVVVVIIGGFAVFVYLAGSLADVMVPLIWAAFFAVPITALIGRIDGFVTSLLSVIRRRLRGEDHTGDGMSWDFTAEAGDNCITLSNDDAKELTDKLEHPGPEMCVLFPWSKCCQSRIRLVKLTTEEGEQINNPEVDRLVANWCYYVKMPDETGHPTLQLYLDQDCIEYPAVVSGSKNSERKLKGTVELDRTSVLSWSIAVCLAMILLAFALFIFFIAMSLGFDALQANSHNYYKGVEQLVDKLALGLKHILPPEQIAKVKQHVMTTATTALPHLASTVSGKAESLGFELILFVIYILFWVFEPIPVSSNVAQVIKNYLVLKTVSCLIYAVLMSLLLIHLGCPVWPLFFVVSFLLNYIPEFGFMIVFALVVPAIVFNSAHTEKQREWDTVEVVFGSLLIKIVVANILEVYLYVSRGGQYMRMHPVVLMALMMFFQKFFGITGMFLAIPMVAIIKYYLLSADIPSLYLNPSLALVEGDECAPHKNFCERHNATYGSTEPAEARV